MNFDDFIIVKTENDLPKQPYEITHHVYLCVLKSGKTLICKFNNSPCSEFTNITKSTDFHYPERIVAYKRIIIPENILNLCDDTIHKVEYFDGLI